MEKMLYKDDLTGLGNRRYFNRDMKKYLSKEKAEGSLLYMNIRRFKMLNELFGYKFGDKVLVDFANMLKLFFPGMFKCVWRAWKQKKN